MTSNRPAGTRVCKGAPSCTCVGRVGVGADGPGKVGRMKKEDNVNNYIVIISLGTLIICRYEL